MPSKECGRTTTSPSAAVKATCWDRVRFWPLRTTTPWARTASRIFDASSFVSDVASMLSTIAPSRSAPPQSAQAPQPRRWSVNGVAVGLAPNQGAPMVEHVSGAAAACAAHIRQVAYLSIVCGESVDRPVCTAAPWTNADVCGQQLVRCALQCAAKLPRGDVSGVRLQTGASLCSVVPHSSIDGCIAPCPLRPLCFRAGF